MVVPSAAKRSWAPRRSNNNGIFAAVVVTVIATGGAGLVALMLLRSNSPRTLDARTRLNLNVQVPEKRHAVRGVDVQGVNVLEKDNAVRGGDDRSKPFILYGTAWKKDDTADLVSQAVHAGFRSIDTACQPKHYDESGVGYGWKTAAEQLGLSRGDFFLQTKFSSVRQLRSLTKCIDDEDYGYPSITNTSTSLVGSTRSRKHSIRRLC